MCSTSSRALRTRRASTHQGHRCRSDGALYVADGARRRILERLPNGSFVAIAGNGNRAVGAGAPERIANGRWDLKTSLGGPIALAAAPDGDLYVLDASDSRLLVLRPAGSIAALAGDGRSGYVATTMPARSARSAT
jgi:hypothetical protein